ncbi:MAG TPA: hypothetical protein VMV90_13125 [Rectinemataceae bacterium]|nr:hypothetical protein [Rectinemataceae bacterium]
MTVMKLARRNQGGGRVAKTPKVAAKMALTETRKATADRAAAMLSMVVWRIPRVSSESRRRRRTASLR